MILARAECGREGRRCGVHSKEDAVHRTALIVLAVLISSSAIATADVDREVLRKELAARRDLNLKRFHAYREARIYPHNSYEEGAVNVWRDADGHLCAVATMVFKDGLEQLTEATATANNFIKIADVTTGPLADWALTSGFTQEELVMIQWPSYEEDMRRARQGRKREDRRLFAGYRLTEQTLRQERVREAGLDLAVARLAARPELVPTLHDKVAKAVAKP
jgi:hypothetical protein